MKIKFLVIVLCVLFLTSIVFLYLNGTLIFNQHSPLLPQSSKYPWKIYSNSSLGYSFQYPSSWAVYQFPGTKSLMVAPISIVQDASGKIKKGTMPENGYDTVLNIDPYLMDGGPDVSTYYQTVTQQPIIISGIKATEYITKFTQSIGFANAGDIEVIVVVDTNKRKLTIGLSDYKYKSIFNHIISSFIFIN
jgi:hypothetical protein